MFELATAGGIARLTLARPAARNAIPIAGWSVLAARALEAGEAGARLLILTGAGGAFCAGADVTEFAAFRDDPAAAATFRQAMRGALDALRTLSIPTVARIEGACFGAGVALAMACDLRFASPRASFAITPAKFGISFPQEDVHRLVSLVGEGQAARLLLGGGAIDGREAERIGLVERFAADGLDEEVEAVAAALSANDPDSLRTLKRGLRLAGDGVRRDEEQDRCFDALLGSDALAARLAARRRRRR
ncbi:MAG TPA: enoyl-CoA hydratase-related protein [Allosphingosinicella sp.]|nr:enoyl-CoA hydratase-related protein [Allosphingosinicella sp.]